MSWAVNGFAACHFSWAQRKLSAVNEIISKQMRLFEPAKLGKLSVQNRIVMAAMGLGDLVDADGTLSQKGIDYYVARAKGGTGLIITSGARPTRQTERHIRRLRVETRTDIEWLKSPTACA